MVAEGTDRDREFDRQGQNSGRDFRKFEGERRSSRSGGRKRPDFGGFDKRSSSRKGNDKGGFRSSYSGRREGF